MSEIKVKDMLDRDILVGDICVYPVRRGSKLWMNRIVVKSITVDDLGKPTVVGIKQDNYPVRVKALDRLAIVGRDGMLGYVQTKGDK